MADQSLIDGKIDVSRQLVVELNQSRSPLLAAYWDWNADSNRWIFYLVPKTSSDEGALVKAASEIMVRSPYRSAFSLSDVVVDKAQIERARAIGDYVRVPRDIGKRFDTTFTGGHYFEGVIVIFVAPELAREHRVA